MHLSDAQRDALTELGNIGISRAARQLSLLLNEPIRIAVPRVDLCAATEASRYFDPNDGVLACVTQRMSGDLEGRIALLLPSRDSHLLFQKLLGDGVAPRGLDPRAHAHDAMTEIGNILISSCVSAMADMLAIRIDVSVPRYAEASAQGLFQDATLEDAARPALLIHTRMNAARRGLEGTILLMLSAAAAEKVMFAVQAMILTTD